MTNLMRVRASLTGWEGGPGLNQFWFSQGSLTSVDMTAVTAASEITREMLYAIRGTWRPGVQVQVEPSVSIHDAASGEIVDILTLETPEDVVVSPATNGQESPATAIVVNLLTNVFRNGRLVRGRTFISPIAGGQIGNDGKVNSDSITNIASAYAGLIDGLGPKLCVYTRPSTHGATDGLYEDVTVCRVAPKAGILKSRRD